MAENPEPQKNPWFVPEHRQGQENLRAGTVILPPDFYDELLRLKTDFASMVGDTIDILVGEDEEVRLGKYDRRAVRGDSKMAKTEIAGTRSGIHREWPDDPRIDKDFPRYPKVYSRKSYERIPHEQFAYFLSEVRRELERNPESLTAAECKLLRLSDQAVADKGTTKMIIEEFICRGIGHERQRHIIEQTAKFLCGQEVKIGGAVEIPSLAKRKTEHGSDPLYWEFWQQVVAGERTSESEMVRPVRGFEIYQKKLGALGFQGCQSVDPIRNIWARRMHRIIAEMLQSLINRVTCDVQYRSPSGESLEISNYRINCDYADVISLDGFDSIDSSYRYSPCSVKLEQFTIPSRIASDMRKFCLSLLQERKVKPNYKTPLEEFLRAATYNNVKSAKEFLNHWIDQIGEKATIADLFERDEVEVVDKNPAGSCPVAFDSASGKLKVALDALSGDSVLNYCDALVENIRLVPDAEQTIHPVLKRHLFPS